MSSPALLNQYPQSIEQLVVAWLAPLRRSGVAYRDGDPLPFTLVTRIAGVEDIFLQLDNPVVSVHTLTDKTLGYANAVTEGQTTHRRMLRLGWYLDDITLPDGTIAAVDYAKVFQAPEFVRFEDVMILRIVERWTIGLSYINDTSS